MHFSVMYRLRWYCRRSHARGVKQVRGGKTSYFRAKCVNITRQMALMAAALLQASH